MDVATTQDLTYRYGEAPAPAATIEVAPGIHWVRMPLPFQLDHINLWLIDEGDGWTVIDTGYSRDEARDLWEQLFTGVMAGRPVKRVIVTHCHPDHVGMAEWLTERFGCELWMTEAEFLMANCARNDIGIGDLEGRVDFFRRHGLRNGRARALAARGNYYRRGVPGLPGTFRRMQDGDLIEIGPYQWRIITGRGHSPNHALLYCEALHVLIAGDHVLPRITPNVSVWHIEPQANPIRYYLDSLDKFRGLPFDTLVLPAHGRVFQGLHTRLEHLAAHHDDRLRAAEEACAEPRCAEELLAVLFRRELDVHQLTFAMGEAIAHLNFLRNAGRLSSHLGEDGIERFVRA